MEPNAISPYAEIALDALAPSPTNLRKTFADLEDLAASIREQGVMQPILTRLWPNHYPTPEGRDIRPLYEIVAGERRYRASLLAGLATIPALVRPLTTRQVLEAQIVENLQRRDVTELEEAEGYQVMMRGHGYSADDLADKVGKSRAYIYARLKLMALCVEARQLYRDGKPSKSNRQLYRDGKPSKSNRQLYRDGKPSKSNRNPRELALEKARKAEKQFRRTLFDAHHAVARTALNAATKPALCRDDLALIARQFFAARGSETSKILARMYVPDAPARGPGDSEYQDEDYRRCRRLTEMIDEANAAQLMLLLLDLALAGTLDVPTYTDDIATPAPLVAAAERAGLNVDRIRASMAGQPAAEKSAPTPPQAAPAGECRRGSS